MNQLRRTRLPWSMYSILAEYPVDEILAIAKIAVEETEESKPLKREFIVNGVTYTVSMGSSRYKTFLKSKVCATCGLVGTVMRLELSKGIIGGQPCEGTSPHFNLYGPREDGIFILFTKDHIFPKSKGGAEHIDNYQTMCAICNGKKGCKVLPEQLSGSMGTIVEPTKLLELPQPPSPPKPPKPQYINVSKKQLQALLLDNNLEVRSIAKELIYTRKRLSRFITIQNQVKKVSKDELPCT
jgi:HNH endonuclease